jgi:hypothetical protein
MANYEMIMEKLQDWTTKVAVIGLGYFGLPRGVLCRERLDLRLHRYEPEEG